MAAVRHLAFDLPLKGAVKTLNAKCEVEVEVEVESPGAGPAAGDIKAMAPAVVEVRSASGRSIRPLHIARRLITACADA